MSDLYGAFIESSGCPRYIYERADGPQGADAKLVSVNHVVRDPSAAVSHHTLMKTKHTEYVPLGQCVGPDCSRVLRERDRRLGVSKKSTSVPVRGQGQVSLKSKLQSRRK